MDRKKLFSEFQKWLEGEKLGFLPDPEELDFRLGLGPENGTVSLHVICEDSPATLQLVCGFPLKVSAEKKAATSQLLHNLNRQLRIGAFAFNLDKGILGYRLTVPIFREVDLARQFVQAVGTALNTMDEYLPLLALHVGDTAETRKALVALQSSCETIATRESVTNPRFNLN